MDGTSLSLPRNRTKSRNGSKLKLSSVCYTHTQTHGIHQYKFVGILLLLFLSSLFISFKSVKHPVNLILSDMEGYYNYLPAVFIYGDFVREGVRDTAYLRTFNDSGKTYTKYTCGVAILEMPFFLATHMYSKWMGLHSDGISGVYGRGLMWAGLFYFWLGMYFLYHLSKRYYTPRESIFSLAGIGLGTNLYYYTFFQPAMSHVYSFFLFAVFLWLIDLLFLQKKFWFNSHLLSFVIMGLVFGMIVLVRPTNVLIAILPLYIWF